MTEPKKRDGGAEGGIAALPGRWSGLGPLARLKYQEYALGIVVVLIFVVGSILEPDSFPTSDNIRNMLTQASVVGVIAMGMTFVIATGGIDLSVGSAWQRGGYGGRGARRSERHHAVFVLGTVGFAALLGTVNATRSRTAGWRRSSRPWRCSR